MGYIIQQTLTCPNPYPTSHYPNSLLMKCIVDLSALMKPAFLSNAYDTSKLGLSPMAFGYARVYCTSLLGNSFAGAQLLEPPNNNEWFMTRKV